MGIACIRSFIAGSLVLLYMRKTHMKLVINKHSLFGGIALAGTMLLFCSANKLTTAANAIVLQFTSPIFVMLISAVFLGARFSKADILAVVFTFLGISLFFLDELDGGNMLGNFVALGSGLTFGCYYISLGGSPEDERMSAVAIGNILTFTVGLPFFIAGHPQVSAVPVLVIILLGVIQLGIPYILLARASGYCPPLVCSLLGALEPLLNPVWVLIFDGEAPGLFALIGGVIVILTITVWCVRSGPREAETNDRAAS